jgi:hypothetical protein
MGRRAHPGECVFGSGASTPVELTSLNPSLLSGNGKHVSPVRRQSGFDSPSRLLMVHAELAQQVRGAPFRAERFAVRIRGSVLGRGRDGHPPALEGEPDRRAGLAR